MTLTSPTRDARFWRSELSNAMRCLEAGDAAGAVEALRTVANAATPTSVQLQMSRLAGRIAMQHPNLLELRIAFCADCTVGDLVAALRLRLLLEGWCLNAHIVPIGTWRQQVYEPVSPLYQFRPELVWVFVESSALRTERSIASGDEAIEDVRNLADELSVYAQQIQNHCGAQVIVNNVSPPAWRVLGNLDGNIPGGVAHTVQLFNSELPRYLPVGAVVFDLAYLASWFGLSRWEDRRLWLHSRHPFSIDAHAEVASAMARLVVASKGRSRKCIVLDLDNTLWGGVLGDDGIEGLALGPNGGAGGEAFAGFQSWLKAYAARGVLLAICSKNDAALARNAFEKHPGMVLSLNDIAAFRINWHNKADNIRALAAELNIDLSSMVFVDDNPAERALVRQELPEVEIVELSEDPSDYIACLASGRWFESLTITPDDLLRRQAYRDNAARRAASVEASNLPAYLHGLNMQATWGGVDDSNLARFTQLINKTNQFHLTTTRYSQAEVSALQAGGQHWLGCFSLRDRFGDNGIVAAVILNFKDEIAWIDTWAMSCRVFARTMEDFTLLRLVMVARQRGCIALRGRFRPTAKNLVVANLYRDFGAIPSHRLSEDGVIWDFDLLSHTFKDSPYIVESRQMIGGNLKTKEDT